MLRLLRENNFPRIWVPSPENRDLRQLLWHRHRMVQMRTRIMNQLQALAMNEGQRRKKKLWNEQDEHRWKASTRNLGIPAPAGSARAAGPDEPSRPRRSRNDRAGSEEMARALRLMTHPGVGPLTALAFVLIIGLRSDSIAVSKSAATSD